MESVISGLNKVYAEWENNSFVIKENDEDIHTANEVWMNFNIRKAFEIIVYLLIIRDACVK
jgi:argininosuccinate lyase